MASAANDREKALDAALAQIERQFGKGSVMRLGEEGRIPIDVIAGTSMGAVIGGLYCAGKLDAYTDWVTGLSQRDVIRLLDPSIKAPGLIKAEKVMAVVRDLLDGARIEDLPLPFTAVATDLIAQREVWFQDGPVEAALRASIAIPSAIAPVVVDGRLLADGGLLNTLPITPLTSARADLVMAVDCSDPALAAATLAAAEAELSRTQPFAAAGDGCGARAASEPRGFQIEEEHVPVAAGVPEQVEARPRLSRRRQHIGQRDASVPMPG